jgi:putative ABC transport system substrate-binding protein
MTIDIGRREFIAALGGAAFAWPLAARAQSDRVRRIGALMAASDNDPEAQPWVTAFQQGLEKLGWTVGRNLRIDYRWTGGNVERGRTMAAELIAMTPDVLLAGNTPTLAALQQATRTIPIVFVLVSDPVGPGFVANLAHPGGNVTGFVTVEPSLGGRWLQLLKQVAPGVGRVAFMFNPEAAPYAGLFTRPAEAAAQSLGVHLISSPVHNAAEIEGAITELAREPGGGLIAGFDITTIVHRKLLIALAAKHRLPALYSYRFFATDGGLISYGIKITDQYRLAVGYVDRILRGEKPADLPVQAPTKFELVINLKTAKALGLEIPPNMLAIADEVIE